MHSALASFVSGFSGRSVLLVGDVMLDEYLWGDARRICPEAPVPVLELTRRTLLPGGAGNTAANVRSLGGEPLLGGVLGKDLSARNLLEILTEHGIAKDGLVADASRPTTTKLRIVARTQQIVRVDNERRTPISAEIEERLLAWSESHLKKVGACVLSDYDKGVVTSGLARGLIQRACEAGTPVVVDPKGADFQKYRGASVITPNLAEVEKVLGIQIESDDELARAGTALAETLNGTAVLITRGAAGMSLFQTGADAVHIPAEARQVFDVTGAGDTVVSTVALALAAGAGLEDAARLANKAAGIAVGVVGTARVTNEDLLKCISAEQS